MEHEPLSEVDRWVQRNLPLLRAPLRYRRTVFGYAGRFRPLSKGELRITSPDGTPVRVVDLVDEDNQCAAGTQVEHDERLHAVVRPQALGITARMNE